MSERVEVRVLLLLGDQADLTTPDHGPHNALRMPAADIARDAGLPANELPGRRLTAIRDGDSFRDFQLVDDPRI
ncbi:hypothetical protein ACGFNU_24475 [Spirillospora sp. NPDC048911]|uniref:hypothetical protein n=1 Tax=Spirillospora sp. NPDC048911 TaxID=3364527 RepID=UPI003715A203